MGDLLLIQSGQDEQEWTFLILPLNRPIYPYNPPTA